MTRETTAMTATRSPVRDEPQSRPHLRQSEDSGKVSRSWRDQARTAEDFLRPPGVLGCVIAFVAVIAYGNEIFNNHLTIDEELFADEPMWRAWLAQGRWGMAAVSVLLVPRPVGPVVSTALGVLGFAFALQIFVRTLTDRRTVVLLAVAFAAVFPTLPFLLSFSTIAYGVGIGAFCAVLAFRILVSGGPPRRFVWAVGLYAFAVAIYEPFVFALPVMALLYVASTGLRQRQSGAAAWLPTAQALACTVGAVIVYGVILWLARAATGVADSTYVAGQIDVAGLLADPVTRLRESLRFVVQVLDADPQVFRGHTRYVGPALLASAAAVLASGARRHGPAQAALLLVVGVALLSGLVLIESLTRPDSNLRTLVYFPFLAAGTAALGLEALLQLDRRRWAATALATLLALATIGLMSDMNRLFLSTELVFERDAALARDLDQRISALVAESGRQPSQLVLVGAWAQIEGPATPKRETMGASFFEWSGGHPTRAAELLYLVAGRKLDGAQPHIAGEAAIKATSLPVWPLTGSVDVQDDVVLVKLSKPTTTQKALWCDSGVEHFCTR
jgi:MFS family permease